MGLSLFNRSKMTHEISMGHHQIFLLSLSVDSNLWDSNEKMSGNSTKVPWLLEKGLIIPFSPYFLRLLSYQEAPNLIKNLSLSFILTLLRVFRNITLEGLNNVRSNVCGNVSQKHWYNERLKSSSVLQTSVEHGLNVGWTRHSAGKHMV